jgi:hypothetical protein
VRVRAPRSAGSQTTTHAPRVGRSSNRPVRPAWRARGEIHVQPERKDHGEEYVGQRHSDLARRAVRLHAERHRTCSARARQPRSTPERACFTTCSEATLACAAREVTFYLAVPSPLLSRPALLGPVSGPSSFCHRARSGSAARLASRRDPGPRRAQGLDQEWLQANHPAQQAALLPRGRAEDLLTRTTARPFHPLTTASAMRELGGGRTRGGPSASQCTRALRDHPALAFILRYDCRVQPPLQVR